MERTTDVQVDTIEQRDIVILCLLIFVFCLVGLMTLSHYGLTFDETWLLLAGERYLHFWATFDSSLLDFSQHHPADYRLPDHPRFDLRDNEPFPAVATTLSAGSCWLFFSRLGWLDPVDAHHLPVLLMGAGTLVVVYLLGREAIGRRAAVFATLALSLAPRFIAHSHFNIKDVPKTFFFSLAIWTFWRATTRRSWHWMVAAGVVFGLALGTRINAVLIPVILVPWLAVCLWRDRSRPATRRWWTALLAYPLLAAAAWAFTSPLMVTAPLDTLGDYVAHWTWLGFGSVSLSTWSPYALIYVTVVTPPFAFLLATLGIVVGVRELGEDPRWSRLLLLLWVAIPLLRTALPNATNYDGIRQFLEFLPAFCLLGGLGAQRLLEALEGTLHRCLPEGVAMAIIGCAFVPILIRIIQIHPHELAYFNAFVGGLPGAQKLNLPDATDYWGSSQRHGIAWLNTNAELGASLYLGEGNINMVKPVSNVWLRDDITLLQEDTLDENVPTPVYVSHITRPVFYDTIDHYCDQNMDPVHAVTVDGLSILKIYRLERSTWVEALDRWKEDP